MMRSTNRSAGYQLFLRLFLDPSSFTRLCQVHDPDDDISIVFDPDRYRLVARAPRAPQVDDGALGYHLTYYDFDFQADITDDMVTITTVIRLVFKHLFTLNTDEQRHWETNRQGAYWDFYSHFFAQCLSVPAHDIRIPAATHSQPPSRSCQYLRAVSDSVYMMAAIVKPVFRIVGAYPFCSRPNGFF